MSEGLKEKRQAEMFSDLLDHRAPNPIHQSADPVWTAHKAKLIAFYLYSFVQITKHGCYIDGFAGPKNPELEESWSAELVLRTKMLRNFFLNDMDAAQFARLVDLQEEQTEERRGQIVLSNSDFNIAIDGILGSGIIKDSMATFCLVDQFGAECHWSTVEKLARHKSDGSRKIEIFYFFMTGWLHRTLVSTTRNTAKLDAWWGSERWRDLTTISGDAGVKDMTLRFRDELGYRHASAWPLFGKMQGQGREMFHMIHASDHPRAPQLMNDAWHKVIQPLPSGQQMTFDQLLTV